MAGIPAPNGREIDMPAILDGFTGSRSRASAGIRRAGYDDVSGRIRTQLAAFAGVHSIEDDLHLWAGEAAGNCKYSSLRCHAPLKYM